MDSDDGKNGLVSDSDEEIEVCEVPKAAKKLGKAKGDKVSLFPPSLCLIKLKLIRTQKNQSGATSTKKSTLYTITRPLQEILPPISLPKLNRQAEAKTAREQTCVSYNRLPDYEHSTTNSLIFQWPSHRETCQEG